MSILDKYRISDIKAAGGNCMSIATAEQYYNIYMKYLYHLNVAKTKMTAYVWTSDECCISERVVMRAVLFCERLVGA